MDAEAERSNPILARSAGVLAGGVCAFALMLPLAGQQAAAQGWQVTTQYSRGISVRTVRKLGPGSGERIDLKEPAPGNNCRVPAFEVMNPKRGETRCVGYVAPWWLD